MTKKIVNLSDANRLACHRKKGVRFIYPSKLSARKIDLTPLSTPMLRIRIKSILSVVAIICSGVQTNVIADELTEPGRAESLQLVRMVAAPIIDGAISESEWTGASVVDQAFVQNEPEYGKASPFRTIVRIGQTDSALYVAIEAIDPQPDRLAAASTQRDGKLERDDSVAILLDTFSDDRTAYLFRTNALATQEDGRIADNGRTVDYRWDAAWLCAATRQEDRWVVEIEIPFSILKYDVAEEGNWGINFIRTIPRRLETSLWAGPVQDVYRVSRFGELTGINAPEQIDPWQFIPYLLGSIAESEDVEVEVGADIRWRPSSKLGVDLTVNPDFALVEADVETINLSRFELKIPEKRPFFLEGNEMFSQRISQFYSRRIGDIQWGAKVSGKAGRTDFSAITSSSNLTLEDELDEASADYNIVRMQHSLRRGSSVGLLAANRNFQDDNSGSAGIDTSLFFSDTFGMTAQLLSVHGPTADGGLAWFLRPSWDTATSHFHVRYTNLDAGILEDINAVGFLNDDDRKEFDTKAEHTFWINSGPIQNVEPSINYNRFWSQDGVLRSWETEIQVDVEFRNGWDIEIQHVDEFKLFEKEFRNDLTTLEIGWDGRDGRSVSVVAGSGVNFDADLTLYGIEAEWPVGDRWRFSYKLERLELEPNLDSDSTTIHVLDVLYAFHPDLFAKVFIQTNSEINKENIQVLWVWRFQPPFGSLQLAYQRGTSEQGEQSQQGDTFFSKLSWVF